MTQDTVRIGGASGYWGDASYATKQLLGAGNLDFIVYDYLAEITMSIMARARAKDPQAGYATDFVTSALAPNIMQIAEKQVRIISNAGGTNPQACGQAVRDMIAKTGADLSVAVITGDDLMDRAGQFADQGITDMFSGEPFPDPGKIASINAYLGAFPIAAALKRGADIVITGRCVDSAVTLGACIHAFGWEADQFDLLAAGSLAGHIIECGSQATGGNFTDWRDAGDLAQIGYPIVEVEEDGRFTVSKPEGSTGIVSRGSVGEQMLYEIGDPQAYLLPDVACDFSDVTIEESGENQVVVSGARGNRPPETYKVSATFADGFRAGQLLAFNGFEARAKAQAYGEASIERARAILRSLNAPDYDETSIEISGGATGNVDGYEEVMLKAAVRHRDARAVGLFLREMTGLGLATPAGMSAFTGGGRARPSPVVRLFSFAVPKSDVQATVDLGEGPRELELHPDPQDTIGREPMPAAPDQANLPGRSIHVPLIRLAWARSGDKGNNANIGVMARRPEYMPWIWSALDEMAIASHFADYLDGKVARYYLPGSHSMNILLHDVLGGGGIASLRNDAQGKGYAQLLLAHPIPIPQKLADSLPSEAA
ncbi:MAG: acyclic terpene utilization AtuA family protein [Rhizobiaceae bacterium]